MKINYSARLINTNEKGDTMNSIENLQFFYEVLISCGFFKDIHEITAFIKTNASKILINTEKSVKN